VAIRTAVIGRDGEGVYGVGGGVVADSDPASEYDEALLKGRVLAGLAAPYGLIETFRWSAEFGFVRLSRHLDRLAGSARALGFVFDPAACAARLQGLAQAWTSRVEDRRVRLVLARDGLVEITDQPVGGAPRGALSLGLADIRLDAGDPLLRHKTTRREAYDQAFAQAEHQGWDEAVLLNRGGLVADGSRNSIFLARNGRLITPAVAHGALPGVLRAALIAEGRASEGEVWPADLEAGSWWIGNSLHGLREAMLSGAPAQ
jgi:para-aminobenzoate synthetase/4-amino-4-deoxychorismate lyase